MSETLRTVGEVVTRSHIEVIESLGQLELRAGSLLVATGTSEEDGTWNIDIVSYSREFNSFYVTTKNEAIDAMEDLGTFYRDILESK